MTQYDYALIARALSESFPRPDLPDSMSREDAWRNVVQTMAEELSSNDPEFDHFEFVLNCDPA